MRPALVEAFLSLRFEPHPPEGMTARIEGIDFVAVEHPWKGLALMATFAGERRVAQWESFIPTSSSVQDIAKELARAIETMRPEMARNHMNSPVCACGCGNRTGGGAFLPGHDQKLRARVEATAGGLLSLARLVDSAESFAKGKSSLESLGAAACQACASKESKPDV